jgi:uncharacterized protein (DUF302 family)
MDRKVISPLLWFMSGMVLMGLISWEMLPSLIRMEYKSPQSYEVTVASLNDAIANKHNWKLPQIFNTQNNRGGGEYDTGKQNKAAAQCPSLYTFEIKDDELNQRVTIFMPFAIGVYEDETEQVYVSHLNVRLLRAMFGGNVAEVAKDAGMDVKGLVTSVTTNKP